MLTYVRGHWSIENQLHWSLDVTFREDTLRHRIGHSAENFSRIRWLALNLLRRDKTCKNGLKGKDSKRARNRSTYSESLGQGPKCDCPACPKRDTSLRCFQRRPEARW